eukprot:INCI6331.1.p1 GENE.INCI6331.1~~INCI6331.1.p1  ORF type:complete len:646 (-),score=60.01 INCI6331.1:328-2265(-)
MSGGGGGTRHEIGSFFSKLGAEMKKGFDSFSVEMNKLVKPKPKLWREWTPELAQEFKEFIEGPNSVNQSVPRLCRLAPKLSERRFHYNSPADERQGRYALCRTLRKLVGVLKVFHTVPPRYKQTVQDTMLKALVRGEFDLENLHFKESTMEPSCPEYTRLGIREYRKILSEIFQQVVIVDLNRTGLENSHKALLVRLFAVCFLRLTNVQQRVLQFINKHIMHHRRLAAKESASIQDSGSGGGSGNSGGDASRSEKDAFPSKVEKSGTQSCAFPSAYECVDRVFQQQRARTSRSEEREFCRNNPSIFMWDYFVNEFDIVMDDDNEQEHPQWLHRTFCNGLWVCTFLMEYTEVVRLSLDRSGTKFADSMWHLLPCYEFVTHHFTTVLTAFLVGLRKRTINLWDIPKPEGEYDDLEMRIDNGQNSLRTMLQYVQVSLHNPILLRIYMHIVFANTSLFDYPNMGRSLDWVASWCRCVALLSPNGVIRSQDVDLEMLVLAVRIMLRNEYVIGLSHSLCFLNNIIKFLNPECRAELWQRTVLDPSPVDQPILPTGHRKGGMAPKVKGVSTFALLMCSWNMAIRRMFTKLVVYQTFSVNRRFLPVASDRALMDVLPPPSQRLEVCRGGPCCLYFLHHHCFQCVPHAVPLLWW